MDTDLSLFENAKNLIKQVYFTEIKNRRINRFGKEEILYKKIDNQNLKDELKQILKKYYEDGYGYKLLVKKINLEGFTYTRCRKILKDLGINVRKGNNVITEHLRIVRRENAKVAGTFKNWPVLKPELIKNNKRFIGGYYYNKSKSKYVYLRSSWEYAYAKWLDDTQQIWDIELKQFKINNDLLYLPDFFIYDGDKIKKIVEIKSSFYYTSAERMKKYYVFKELYSKDFQIELINKLEDILKLGNYSSKNQLARCWKKIRKEFKEP